MSDIFGGPPEDEGYDPLGYPVDFAEVEDPHGFFHGDVPEDWWYETIGIEDEFGDVHYATVGEWYDATMQDEELTNLEYNMDPWDIIYDLEEYGYWDSDDWEVWKEAYGGSE